MIDDPEYRRLTEGWFDNPDPALWQVVQGWCEERGEWGAASIWQNRRTMYRPVYDALQKAWHAYDNAPVAVVAADWRVVFKKTPKRLAYRATYGPKEWRAASWGDAYWHYWSIMRYERHWIGFRTLCLIDYLHRARLDHIMGIGRG